MGGARRFELIQNMIKKKLNLLITLVTITIAGVSSATAQTASAEINLPESSAIDVHLVKAVSSKTAQRGDTVEFLVDNDLLIDGQVLVKKDTVALATVIHSEKSGYLGRSGKLALQVESTKTIDGKLLPLRAAKGGEGDSAAGTTIALSMLVGPFGLFKKGGDTVITEGTKLTVYTAEPRRFSIVDGALASVEMPVTVSNESATVYIYRPKKYVGGALEPSIFCDGVELAKMDNGRYFVIKLSPGKHVIHMTDPKKGYELNFAPGQTYYFRVGIEAGMFKGKGKLVLESNEKGTAEVQKIKPLDADKIRDTTMVQAAAGGVE
jgi:hypothetical protein